MKLTNAEKAVRAMFAWFYCEQNHNISFQARTELCNYTEHLCQRAIDDKPTEYDGLPRLYLSGIERATEEQCEAIIDEVFASIAKEEEEAA